MPRRALDSACLVALALASLALALASPAIAQPRPLRGGAFDGRAYPSHWARAPLLDAARAAADVDAAWERFGVRGRGATVCVVDTGLDLAHRDFQDTDGRTRVDFLLDLDAAPRGSEPALEARFGGAVYRADELDAMLAAGDPGLPTDWHGHGTTVTSAAAGDDAPAGVGSPGMLAGVAPEARLVVVRALRRGATGFADEDVARGVAFCAAVADPARTVVLLSLGGHDGAHDGTSPLEQALAAHVAAGLTIVVAAGNDGGSALHAATRIPAGASTTIGLEITAPDDGTASHVALAVRGTTEVALVAPEGERVGVTHAGESAQGVTRRGRVTVDATREGVVDVVVSGAPETPLAGGRFSLVLGGPAHVDAWIVSADLEGAFLPPSFVGPYAVHGEEVTMPATCEDVVAVGATVSRGTLLSLDGSPALVLEADAEGRALYASRGPSATGAARPDVVAPGGWIVAARSSGVDPSDPANLVHGDASEWARLARPDGRVAIAGTSLSAAIVAGALALAAEAAPLDPLRDRERLAWTAQREGASFTPARGFGAIDVAAFLAARASSGTGGPARSGSLAATRPFTTPGADDAVLALVASAGDAIPDDAWITFVRDGRTLGRAPLRAGIARAHVTLGVAAPGDTLVVEARRDDGVPVAQVTIPVAWTDDGGGATALGGGGCTVGHGGHPIVLVVAWIALRASRKRRSRRAHDASTLSA